ncbi:MAG: amidinotransferase [Proteobacteria bacterium]|nr:amidinotransferase [Pseudomonadota bacterium]
MQQCSDAVLMVRPAAFAYNPETASTNAFQRPDVATAGVGAQPAGTLPAGATTPGAATAAAALAEFDRMVQALRGEGIQVCVAADNATPAKPDAVFPNNWLSFHEDGTLVLYPMHDASRRAERRQEVIEAAMRDLDFRLTHLLDLTHLESQGHYLEGTGSLVLDRAQRVAYACISPRTHPQAVAEWAHELGYEPVVFTAADRAGVPLYHTNVLMAIGERAAVVGAEAIVPADRERVLARLAASGREVVTLTHQELAGFAGNMLELATWDEALGDARVLVMSQAARQALRPQVFEQLSGCTDQVLTVPVPTIERAGGGSVRCMLAEVFRKP